MDPRSGFLCIIQGWYWTGLTAIFSELATKKWISFADDQTDPLIGDAWLKYYLKAGRLKPVSRGVYAVVPPEASIDQFQPDPILVAVVVQPDGVLSHHSALELLGVAHSTRGF